MCASLFPHPLLVLSGYSMLKVYTGSVQSGSAMIQKPPTFFKVRSLNKHVYTFNTFLSMYIVYLCLCEVVTLPVELYGPRIFSCSIFSMCAPHHRTDAYTADFDGSSSL